MGEQEWHRAWGVAEVADDGFINPGQVRYASSEEGAIHKASVSGGTVVTRLCTDWATRPSQDAAGDAGRSV